MREQAAIACVKGRVICAQQAVTLLPGFVQVIMRLHVPTEEAGMPHVPTRQHPFLMPLMLTLLTATGCSKAPTPEQGHTVDLDRARKAAEEVAKRTAQQPPAAEDTPARPPAAHTPTVADAPEGVTGTDQTAPAKKAEVLREPSIALHMSSKTGKAFSMPIQGKTARIRVTPVDEKGRPISEFSPLLGSKLVMIASRSDGSWLHVLKARELSEAARHTHRFFTVFPEAGAHVLLFAFQPAGKPIAIVPAYIHVAGKRQPDMPLPEESLRHVGRRGLEVALFAGSGRPMVCKDTPIATTWTKRGKRLALDSGLPGESRVSYVAMHMSLSTVVFGREAAAGADAKAPGDVGKHGDKGTRSVLRLDRAGTWRVVAMASSDKREITALFSVTTQGTPPDGGCPSRKP